MARLAARCSNLVISITLKNRNHSGEANVRKGRKKSFTQKREMLFRGAL